MTNKLNIKVKVIKKVSIGKYLERIRPYLSNMIGELTKSGKQEIQLPMTIYFISSNGNDDKQLMYLKSDNIKITIDSVTEEIIKELFQLLLTQYQSSLEESRKGMILSSNVKK